MSNTFIHVNFDLLEGFEGLKLLFKKGVISIIEDKFEGTGVVIITDLAEAQNLLFHGLDVKTVAIHDRINHNIENSIGEAYPNSAVSYVDMNNIHATDFDELIQKAGLISSHELGHLFLGDHSIAGVNLMADGNIIDDLMNSDNRMDLDFTELQKLLIAKGKPDGQLLSDIESLHLETASQEVSEFIESLFRDFGL